MIVDFHTHSLASDGALAPMELLRRAKAAGIRQFALTDHDTTAGYLSVRHTSEANEVGLISGVELSCRWATTTVHVVGLDFDADAPVMIAMVEQLTQAREERAEKIATRLAGVGIEGALEGAKAIANESQIGRPHFATWLAETGAVASVTDAFDKYLGAGKIGDVKMFWPPLSDVVQAITRAGGVAILAHPLKYRLTGMKLRALINDFKAAGGGAIEVLNGRQPETDLKRLSQLAEGNGLMCSVGSDFHRDFEYGPKLGIDVERLPNGAYVWDALEASA
ncbi:MAG: PHP domain-containing protein [Pseudomonadota bacterium]|mgnify:FL=1|nr:PHP domain-containing protein [Pseudomonadota bacterium]